MSPGWLVEMGATAPVIIIFIMGVMFAGYTMLRDRAKDRLIALLFEDVKELRYLYNQVDKQGFGTAIAIQIKHNKEIKLVKQSANGAGDHALNRDIM